MFEYRWAIYRYDEMIEDKFLFHKYVGLRLNDLKLSRMLN